MLSYKIPFPDSFPGLQENWQPCTQSVSISFTIQEFKQEYFQNKTNYRVVKIIFKNPKMELRCNKAQNCNKKKF